MTVFGARPDGWLSVAGARDQGTDSRWLSVCGYGRMVWVPGCARCTQLLSGAWPADDTAAIVAFLVCLECSPLGGHSSRDGIRDPAGLERGFGAQMVAYGHPRIDHRVSEADDGGIDEGAKIQRFTVTLAMQTPCP